MTEQDIVELIGDFHTGHCSACHEDPKVKLIVLNHKGEDVEVCCTVSRGYRKWKREIWAKKK